jgi:hypothetical protein
MTGQSPLSSAQSNEKPERRPRHLLRNAVLGIVGVLLILFIGIQFIPVHRTNPPVTSQIQWDSSQTQVLAQRACMDCHSNETTWKWYSYIAPASWLIYYDVERGRNELNLSTLGAAGSQRPVFTDRSNDLAYKFGQVLAGGGGERGPSGREFRGEPPAEGQRRPEGQAPGGFGGFAARRVSEALQNGSMPPAKYTMLHPEAVLSDAERQQLEQGLQATLSQATQAAQ